jgi:hypothetical protein
MQSVLKVPTIYFTIDLAEGKIEFITDKQYDHYLGHHPQAKKVGYINELRLLVWWKHDILSIEMPQLQTLISAFQSLNQKPTKGDKS